MSEQEDFLRPLIREILQEVLETEMDETVGAEKGERTPNRRGYRSGYYGRTLVTRVGKLELRVPQDRQRHFRTEVFERYQRSEKAMAGAMTEMYMQGVSTRKVKAISEELCRHEVSASTISRLNVKLDEELERFATRRLSEAFSYLILAARYEKVREDGTITNQAVMIAIHVDWEGLRNVLAVEFANRESFCDCPPTQPLGSNFNRLGPIEYRPGAGQSGDQTSSRGAGHGQSRRSALRI
jgi:putative transposase